MTQPTRVLRALLIVACLLLFPTQIILMFLYQIVSGTDKLFPITITHVISQWPWVAGTALSLGCFLYLVVLITLHNHHASPLRSILSNSVSLVLLVAVIGTSFRAEDFGPTAIPHGIVTVSLMLAMCITVRIQVHFNTLHNTEDWWGLTAYYLTISMAVAVVLFILCLLIVHIETGLSDVFRFVIQLLATSEHLLMLSVAAAYYLNTHVELLEHEQLCECMGVAV
jgi:hypothetical protein